MSDTIRFRKDDSEFANIKAEAQVVRDCFDTDVIKYLEQFPTESDEKFKYRSSPRISKFTNFTASAINAITGIALKKLPKVDDEDLLFLPRMIGDALANVGCDGIGYLFIDAPKLEASNQKENTPVISYISVGRVIGKPLKDMSGNITDFTFEGSEDAEIDNKTVTRKYRKRIFLENGVGRGEKYVQVGTDKYILDPDESTAEWEYSFEGLPVIDIDILTANKHPYIDVANVNLWLYNLESDHRNIVHLICTPYVQFFGELKEDNSADGVAQVYIGADRARRFNDKSKEGIVITEATGSGVEHAEKLIESTKDTITRMSASVMSNTNFKTATQAENAESKSLGFLPFVVISMEDAFNRAIEFMGHFRGRPYNGGVTMAKKFSRAEFNAAQLGFVENLHQNGIITKTTLLDVAKDADLIPASMNNEDEIREAEEQLGNVA